MTATRVCEFCGRQVRVLMACGCPGEVQEAERRAEADRQHRLKFEPKGKRIERQLNWEANGSLRSTWMGQA
jgi:hypothetical protein